MTTQDYTDYYAKADRILEKIRKHLHTPTDWETWHEVRRDGARFLVEEAVANAGLTDEELEFYEDDIDFEYTLIDEVWNNDRQDL